MLKWFILSVLVVFLYWHAITAKTKTPTTYWSQKEIIFCLPQNGKTNNVGVLTGLRSDGVFVWKLNRTGFEYDAKAAKDDD